MSKDEMLSWFGKILDAVRMRYRKLQRFARRHTPLFENAVEYALDNVDLAYLLKQLRETGHFLVYTDFYEAHGLYILASGALWGKEDQVRALMSKAFFIDPLQGDTSPNDLDVPDDDPPAHHSPSKNAADDEHVDEAPYLVVVSPTVNFAWLGTVMNMTMEPVHLALEPHRCRLIANGTGQRLALCRDLFEESIGSYEADDPDQGMELECLIPSMAHLPRIQKELKKITQSTQRLTESIIQSASVVRRTLATSDGTQELIENWYAFASDHAQRVVSYVPSAMLPRFHRLVIRLGISWAAFVCEDCDPSDRRTFRWTVNALENANIVTAGENILQLDGEEFATLRKSVASLVSFLILHFDILGARSSMEAKKEAERIEATRRLQRLSENTDDDLGPRGISPSGRVKPEVERSIRMTREERLRLITELEGRRMEVISDQHLIGQVLDEEVSEDRALVFLAASSQNIALKWQQGQFIGGGANGNVYVGFNLESGRVMAVKEIRVQQDLKGSQQLLKQIKDEADVMSVLRHQNVVEYYGIEVSKFRRMPRTADCSGASRSGLHL